MVVLGVNRYGASFVPIFLQKVLKNGWVQVDSPCAQTGVKIRIFLKDGATLAIRQLFVKIIFAKT